MTIKEPQKMSTLDPTGEANVERIFRAIVEKVHSDGTITTDLSSIRRFDHLANAPICARGDHVLVWVPDQTNTRGVVIGLISSRPKDIPVEPSREDVLQGLLNPTVPDELVIEAKHSLTLRVGAGSITIREDGKILIKGKDLVSHAQRLNRIKGGAVQIN